MKNFILIFLLLTSISSFSQKYVLYQNAERSEILRKNFKDKGIDFRIQPTLIDLNKDTRLFNVVNDFKVFLENWHNQVISVEFLDITSFDTLNKKNMIVQNLKYVQSKNSDYKWGGGKYYEIFHIFSNLYFTVSIKEYKDRFELDVVVAEKLKN